MFVLATNKVQFVIAQDALCVSLSNQVADEANNSGRVRATVYQISYENQFSAIGVGTVSVVSESIEQFAQRSTLPMNVANDINRTVEELPHDWRVFHV